MAIKKSELYSSLWSSFDELRGRMTISEYLDYFLTLLLIKHSSDRISELPGAIAIPKGSRFADMAAFKGSKDIGDQINKRIIAPLVEANAQFSLSDFPDFNDTSRLGAGQDMVVRLTSLIDGFISTEFDFTEDKNCQKISDILESLLTHVTNLAGKSADFQFLPMEVSDLIAGILNIENPSPSDGISIYDPACGGGSLLVRLARRVGPTAKVYGQETNSRSNYFAKVSLILLGHSNGKIEQGNALVEPKFLNESSDLAKFDLVLSCPPFSLRNWSNGIDPGKDPFDRFRFGIPSQRSSDFAFIQHMIASLKQDGKMAIILPHGILFRGSYDGAIRESILEADLVDTIVSLPANLLATSQMPTCLLIFSKNKPPERRKKVLFVNADRHFKRGRFRNTLQAEHIDEIINICHSFSDKERFSRVVEIDEIRRNRYNLNISRYVDTSEFASLMEQYYEKFEKYQLKDLALEINSSRHGGFFTDKENAVYVHRSIRRTTTAHIDEIKDSHHHYYQIVLRDSALSEYVALFLQSTIGQHSLATLANTSLTPTIDKASLGECFIALPALEAQKNNIETHKKLSTLQSTIERINKDLSLNPTSYEYDAQLDSMLQVVGQLSHADRIRGIIRQGESKTVEFKETYNLCIRKETKEEYVETSALKTLVAFLNSEGGDLLIGVSDAPNIVGIERELKKFHKDNDDKLLLHIKNRLKSRIGEEFYPYINYNLATVDGHKVVHFECKPSEKECFLDRKDFYVRTNPASDKIEGQKLIEYVRNRFNT